jgi:hypothetical protein
MTEKKISYALNRIKSCKEAGFMLEALLKSYHLNVQIILYLLRTSDPDYSIKDKKMKLIIHDFQEEINSNPRLKSILNKKNLKMLKPWLHKMDDFFKTLKFEQAANIKTLLSETEKISAILNISATKFFVKNKAS